MSKVKKVRRKSMKIRESGRSSDYISPSFGHGCLYDCSYCYMKRHKPEGLDVATNTGDILTAINNHVYFDANVKKPNQTDPDYITYDISCNEDFALHSKYYNWERIFEFFKQHDKAKATLATKYIPENFLSYNPERKVRIRFSLMPDLLSSLIEPNTSKIIDRIKAVDRFIEAGYDVHLNFSPVIVYPKWKQDYRELFTLCNKYINNKEIVLSEVIFLTHNKDKHQANINTRCSGENLLWTPSIQENKTSQYGGENIRYKHNLKKEMINDFKEIHGSIIPWNTIRYIF